MPRFLFRPEEYFKRRAPVTIPDLDHGTSGQMRGTCPFCHNRDRKFYVEASTGLWICQQCKQSGGMLKYHSLTKPCDLEVAAKEICHQEPSNNSPLLETQIIASTEVDKYIFALQKSPAIVQFIKTNWQFTDEAIEHFKLGFDPAGGAVTFPIFNQKNQCTNIRYKRVYVPEDYDGNKIWSYKDPARTGYTFGAPALYPVSALKQEELFLVAGEKDMISSWSNGLRNVLTGTGGEGTWMDEWAFDLQGKTVYIVYDVDERGLQYAKELYEKLKHICKCTIITLPEMPEYPSGKKRKDLTDFWLLGRDVNDFAKLVPSKNFFVNSNGKHPVIYNIPLPNVYTEEDEDYLDKVGSKTLIDDYIEYSRVRVNSPRSFHRLCGLWVVSNVLGRRCVSVLNQPVYPNLWAILVGPTTVVQKSSTTDVAVEVLKRIDSKAIAMGSFTPEGALTALARRQNLNTSAIYYDEIGMLFEQIKSKDYMAYMRDMLIKMFNSQEIVYDRSKDRIEISRHYVTLLGSAVSKRMTELLSWKDIESGLFIRFLMAMETEGEGYREQEYLKPDDEFLWKKLIWKLQQVNDRWNKPWEIPLDVNETIVPNPQLIDDSQYTFMFSGDALYRYNRFAEICNTAPECVASEAVMLVHSRLPMFLQKLAMIYAAIDTKSRVFFNNVEINTKHVLLAIRDLDYFRRHMVSLVLTIGSSELEHLVSEAYHYIYTHKRVTRRDVAATLKTSKKLLDEVFDTMNDRGMIVQRRVTPDLMEYMVSLN